MCDVTLGWLVQVIVRCVWSQRAGLGGCLLHASPASLSSKPQEYLQQCERVWGAQFPATVGSILTRFSQNCPNYTCENRFCVSKNSFGGALQSLRRLDVFIGALTSTLTPFFSSDSPQNTWMTRPLQRTSGRCSSNIPSLLYKYIYK